MDRVVLVLEHASRPGMDVHLLGHGEGFDHGAARGEVAVQDGHPAIRAERVRTRPDDLVLVELEIVQVTAPFGEEEWVLLDLLQVLAERLAGNGETIQVERLLSSSMPPGTPPA